jgi:hypothetical protein
MSLFRADGAALATCFVATRKYHRGLLQKARRPLAAAKIARLLHRDNITGSNPIWATRNQEVGSVVRNANVP